MWAALRELTNGKLRQACRLALLAARCRSEVCTGAGYVHQEVL
jgi:hypothetical protein